MKLPPIRYPLPMILGLGLAILLAWSVHGLALSAWNAVAAGFKRAVEGPSVPSSNEPMELIEGIPRRGLLLREMTPAREKPDGAVAETIRHRMFVDIYDVWPLSGEPTHYRVGNRRAIGWVEARDLLPWSTRLVRRPAGDVLNLSERAGQPPSRRVPASKALLPILDWSGDSIREAVWKPAASWSEVETTGWELVESVEEDNLGLLLSREEVLELMRVLIAPEASADEGSDLRLRAVSGRLLSPRSMGTKERADLREALPSWSLALRCSTGTRPWRLSGDSTISGARTPPGSLSNSCLCRSRWCRDGWLRSDGMPGFLGAYNL